MLAMEWVKFHGNLIILSLRVPYELMHYRARIKMHDLSLAILPGDCPERNVGYICGSSPK